MILNAQEYTEYLNNKPLDIPIFYQPFWIHIVSEGRPWHAIVIATNNDEVQGIWPIIELKKWSNTWSINPIFTPFFGPLLFYPPNLKKTESKLSFEKKIMSQMVDLIPPHLHLLKVKISPSIQNWLPLYWRSFLQTTFYTYRISLLDQQNFREDYTSNLRSDIKNSNAIHIYSSDDIEVVIALMESSFEKQNTNLKFDRNILRKIDHELSIRSARNIYIAKNNNEEIVGCVYIMNSQNIAYLPIIGRGNLTNGTEGAVKKLIDHSIEKAKGKGLAFYDFEGSMFAQFEKVFRSFGSVQTPYHVVTRCRWRWLSKLLHF